MRPEAAPNKNDTECDPSAISAGVEPGDLARQAEWPPQETFPGAAAFIRGQELGSRGKSSLVTWSRWRSADRLPEV